MALSGFREYYVDLSALWGAKLLTAPKSPIFKTCGVEESLIKLIKWPNFHRSRVYRIHPNSSVHSAYPVPVYLHGVDGDYLGDSDMDIHREEEASEKKMENGRRVVRWKFFRASRPACVRIPPDRPEVMTNASPHNVKVRKKIHACVNAQLTYTYCDGGASLFPTALYLRNGGILGALNLYSITYTPPH